MAFRLGAQILATICCGCGLYYTVEKWIDY